MFGGILRLAPELFKFLDAKNDRKHELDMQEKAYKFQQLAGEQRVGEIKAQGDAAFDQGALTALTEAIKGQETPSGIKWVDAFSKIIRPLITLQWVIILYPAVIVATFVILLQQNIPIIDAMNKVFGPEEKALVSFIVDFWFIGRVLERGRK
jgi:hypothetical protein